MAQVLTNISPSFNSTRQTGADGADLIDSAALRGLGSDQTLVLVNGKRRHTVALLRPNQCPQPQCLRFVMNIDRMEIETDPTCNVGHVLGNWWP